MHIDDNGDQNKNNGEIERKGRGIETLSLINGLISLSSLSPQ